MTPAFSAAMAPSRVPSSSTCSRSIPVITESTPSTAFTASSRPPSPISSTAGRAPRLRKILERRQRQPLEVRQPGPRPEAPAQVPDEPPESPRGDLARRPAGCARGCSPGAARCTGRPGGPPPAASPREKPQVEPLPLDPATTTEGNERCGLPEPGERAPHRPETELPPEALLALQERFRVDEAHARILRRVYSLRHENERGAEKNTSARGAGRRRVAAVRAARAGARRRAASSRSRPPGRSRTSGRAARPPSRPAAWTRRCACSTTALASDERRARSWNYVGGVHFAQGDLSRALEEFRTALELDPGDVRACNNLGTALERLGDYAGAAEAYGRAVLIDPSYPLTQRNLGILQSRRLGDPAAARSAWQRYLELAPAGAYADEIRRELAAARPGRPGRPAPARSDSVAARSPLSTRRALTLASALWYRFSHLQRGATANGADAGHAHHLRPVRVLRHRPRRAGRRRHDRGGQPERRALSRHRAGRAHRAQRLDHAPRDPFGRVLGRLPGHVLLPRPGPAQPAADRLAPPRPRARPGAAPRDHHAPLQPGARVRADAGLPQQLPGPRGGLAPELHRDRQRIHHRARAAREPADARRLHLDLPPRRLRPEHALRAAARNRRADRDAQPRGALAGGPEVPHRGSRRQDPRAGQRAQRRPELDAPAAPACPPPATTTGSTWACSGC